MARCKSWYIGNDMEFDVPLLIILGLIFTIWSQTFFIIGVERVLYRFINDGMFIAIVLTLIIVFVPTSLALYYGVKQNNSKLVRSWYIIKIIECILIVVDVAINIPKNFIWFPKYDIFVELLLLPFGVYLIVCVIKINKNMTSASPIYQETAIKRPIVAKV